MISHLSDHPALNTRGDTNGPLRCFSGTGIIAVTFSKDMKSKCAKIARLFLYSEYNVIIAYIGKKVKKRTEYDHNEKG